MKKNLVSLHPWPLLRPKHDDDSCFLFERFQWRNAFHRVISV